MKFSQDYWINDPSLCDEGLNTMRLIEEDMEGLRALRKQYSKERPLDEIKITGCITVTYETVGFIRTLNELGAKLRWCPDNKDASIDEACAVAVAEDVPVFAKRGMTNEEHLWCIKQALDFDGGPDFILDDGCELGKLLHETQPDIHHSIRASIEQTTCGNEAYLKYEKKNTLKFSVIDVNSSATKCKFDNTYGSRESLISGIQHALKRQIAGKYAVICGYGETGKGAQRL